MKIIKTTAVFLCLLVTLVAASATFTKNAAAAASSIKEAHVYLKVNDYYVLYTAPKAPFVDQNNRLLIPLRSISELLGATVKYDGTTKTAVIQMENKTVTYQAGSKKVNVDGDEKLLDTNAVLYQGSIFIPLSSFIQNFGIKSEWNQADKLYTLRGERFMQTSKVTNWEELDRFSSLPAADSNAFLPVSYRYDAAKNKVTIKSKNISGRDIAEGQEDVHPYFIFGESAQFDNKNRPRPFVKKDGIIESSWTLNPAIINGVRETLQYILVQGRMLK